MNLRIRDLGLREENQGLRTGISNMGPASTLASIMQTEVGVWFRVLGIWYVLSVQVTADR